METILEIYGERNRVNNKIVRNGFLFVAIRAVGFVLTPLAVVSYAAGFVWLEDRRAVCWDRVANRQRGWFHHRQASAREAYRAMGSRGQR